MDKTFDDLFNEFFNRRTPFNPQNNADRMREDIKKMMDMLNNFDSSNDIDEALEKQMDTTLGKPDRIETFSDGHLFFEKKIWSTPSGDIVKVIVSDRPFATNIPTTVKIKSLQEQLDEAIANEDYLKAAEIRDLINPPKKKRASRKKTDKDSEK
jgi:TusA-related sulfurtransferase